MIYKDPTLQRVFILESETLIGVRLAPLSKYLKDYHGKNHPYKGNIVAARVKPQVDRDKLNRAISYGMDELTKPYDNRRVSRRARHRAAAERQDHLSAPRGRRALPVRQLRRSAGVGLRPHRPERLPARLRGQPRAAR